MPHYDYVCEACGHEFEVYQSITASTKRKCPECSKFKLYRKIGAGAGILFKGSGFYETDYRSDSYKKGAKSADDARNAKDASKSAPKKDAKKSEAKKPDSKQSDSKKKRD